jgi:xanthine dehydrogenase YagT iron-sulfur-binding subunit
MQDRTDQPRSGPDFNRRSFLKGSGVAVAATAITNAVQEAAAKPDKDKGETSSGKQKVTLTVNGEKKVLEIEPRVTLLDALRNDLNLTGCKDVCTTANCGACTVLIDGKAVYACTRLAIAEQGKQVTTIESIVGKSDPVVQGFHKHDATQCGYCTPGFVMATRAFIAEHPQATLEEIQKGLGGNICRCGTYANIAMCAVEICNSTKGGA